jgi:hypothetical protein
MRIEYISIIAHLNEKLPETKDSKTQPTQMQFQGDRLGSSSLTYRRLSRISPITTVVRLTGSKTLPESTTPSESRCT